MKARFDRHRNQGTLAEGTINQLPTSPLLTLAGLYDEPFFVSTEPSLEIELKERDEVSARSNLYVHRPAAVLGFGD